MRSAVILGSIAFITYTYFGYPFVLWILARHRSAKPRGPIRWASVTIVIAAFNEASTLAETLRSILVSDYPSELLDVIVVSDASTDGTDAVASAFAPRVRLLRQSARSGQTAGLYRGARAARGEVVLMADASGIFMRDTVRRLAAPFTETRVGAVSGYKGIRLNESAVAQGDGVYARYDSLLRTLESRTGSSWVGCQGGLFAIRKSLLREDFPLDMAADNAMCYELYEQGVAHRFEPEAVVLERPSEDLANEFRRKVRIIVLQLHGLFFFRRLLNPFRHPEFVFQNLSHKIFRWLVPFALVVLWIASAFDPRLGVRALWFAQTLFYGAAVIGMLWPGRSALPRWLSIPPYFVTVNLAGLVAWFSLFRHYVIWNPPERA